MYKKNAKTRIFKREFENAFYEWRYIFLFLFLILLFYNLS